MQQPIEERTYWCELCNRMVVAVNTRGLYVDGADGRRRWVCGRCHAAVETERSLQATRQGKATPHFAKGNR